MKQSLFATLISLLLPLFAIAGNDRHFYPAQAEFVIAGQNDRGQARKDEARLKVWHPLVKKPEAVRYAWSRNPIGNAVNSRHHERIIPIVSFRTDNWDWPEAPFPADGGDAEQQHRRSINEMRRLARQLVKQRQMDEARFLLKSAER